MPCKYFYNKGEWSEVYAVLKTLADSRIVLARDAATDAPSSLPLCDIFRQDKSGTPYVYRPKGDKIQIILPDGTFVSSRPRSDYHEVAEIIKNTVRSQTSGNFYMPEAVETFLEQIHIDNPKTTAVSHHFSDGWFGGKCDVSLSYWEPKNGSRVSTGFSIKSQSAHPSTLMNFSKDATKMTYRLPGVNDELMMTINNMFKRETHVDLSSRCEALLALGVPPEYCVPMKNTKQAIFMGNLRLINSDLTKIIPECVYNMYFGPGELKTVGEMARYLCDYGEFADEFVGQFLYPKVLKDFLYAVFGGMTPAKPWNGIIEANGGYMVVREDWNIEVIFANDIERFQNYLLENTCFCRPSAKPGKADFGHVYKVGSDYYIDLNFSVRFTR